MLNGFALPFICATNHCFCQQWFVYLREMMKHPRLNADEKYLWLWLATMCTSKYPFSCSFSYEQISQAVDLPTERIHRSLFRLLCMGFLSAPALPIWYGALTFAMKNTVYTYELLLPPKPLLDLQEENALIIPLQKKCVAS